MKNTEIKVLDNATITYTDWCKEAIAFYVSNGKNKLRHVWFEEDSEERYISKFLLNDATLLQMRGTDCPTCAKCWRRDME